VAPLLLAFLHGATAGEFCHSLKAALMQPHQHPTLHLGEGTCSVSSWFACFTSLEAPSGIAKFKQKLQRLDTKAIKYTGSNVSDFSFVYVADYYYSTTSAL
jgi:hypothetical protein